VKYKIELLIQKPRADVWKFFTDPANLKLWQPSLQQIETKSGTAGQPGAESKWSYKEREREFSLIEKVLQREEPRLFASVFENEFASSTVHNIFTAQSENETLWTQETTYKFKTIMMQILGRVWKKNYIARSQREMERFKKMVERA
jgi:uncharacterized protein YndB with AHSA1/START domain